MTPAHDPAQTRLLLLTLARVSGLVVAGVGLLLWQTTAFGAVHPTLGRILIALGLFETLVVPPLLLRRWRTPKP